MPQRYRPRACFRGGTVVPLLGPDDERLPGRETPLLMRPQRYSYRTRTRSTSSSAKGQQRST
eukprot:scaffold36427_cov51-Prasinocladus_malaysianus.AAC.1